LDLVFKLKEELPKLLVIYEPGHATNAAMLGYVLDLVWIVKAFG
jgi:hypothetical protein